MTRPWRRGRRYGGSRRCPNGFQIGSVTKPITGFLLAAMLSAEGAAITLDSGSMLISVGSPSRIMMASKDVQRAVSHYGSLVNLPSDLMGPVDSPGRGYSREH